MSFIGDDRKITIVLADDHEVVRAGIKRLLSIDKGIIVIDEATNGVDVFELVKYHSPDIAMLDIFMPRMNGIETAEKIKQECPGVLVIILTAFEDYKYVDQAMNAGANAYLSKDISAQELVGAIRSVISGERVFSKTIINILQKRYHYDEEDRDLQIIITTREQEILNLVAIGKKSHEIADSLNISVRTVESHRYNLMQKLGCKNAASLVRYAVLKSDYLPG